MSRGILRLDLVKTQTQLSSASAASSIGLLPWKVLSSEYCPDRPGLRTRYRAGARVGPMPQGFGGEVRGLGLRALGLAGPWLLPQG